MDFIKNLKNKKIAILGMGYLGSNIHKFLTNKKKVFPFEIRVITKENLKSIETEIFDYFINCAGNSGDFREDILGTIDSNTHLLTYLLKHVKVRYRFLAISSTRVYGFSNKNCVSFNEDYFCCMDHLSLDFIYDGSKKLMESILINYAKNLKYSISIVRLSNVYGKFNILNDSTLIKKIIKCNKNKEILKTNENRHSEKDYIHIDDAIDGILRCLLIAKGNAIFNIASGKSSSIDYIANFLNVSVAYFGEKECKFSIISINKAKKELGFEPKIGLELGLKMTINENR